MIEPKIPLRAVACLQKIQSVAPAPMPLPSLVVAHLPSGLSTATSSKLQGAAVSREHMGSHGREMCLAAKSSYSHGLPSSWVSPLPSCPACPNADL